MGQRSRGQGDRAWQNRGTSAARSDFGARPDAEATCTQMKLFATIQNSEDAVTVGAARAEANRRKSSREAGARGGRRTAQNNTWRKARRLRGDALKPHSPACCLGPTQTHTYRCGLIIPAGNCSRHLVSAIPHLNASGRQKRAATCYFSALNWQRRKCASATLNRL